MKHLKNIQYIIKHKWYVLIECFNRGIFWRGITHDISKFLPDEFFPYSEHFYGINGTNNRDSIFYEPGKDFAFDKAWLKHIHRNDHHWQHWILKLDNGNIIILPMPEKCRLEMLCDWRGAAKAQGLGNNTIKWYIQNKNKMSLHPDTRKWVEDKLNI